MHVLSTTGTTTVNAMSDAGAATTMVHFECYTCHVSATCVLTPSADLAWCDHMEQHAMKDHYGRWVWEVVPLSMGS